VIHALIYNPQQIRPGKRSRAAMPFIATEIRKALLHLKKNDEVMRGLIREVGPFTLKTQSDYFLLLVRSIISQQISVGAARSIMRRLEARVAPEKISTASLARLSPDELRSLGVSPQKSRYLIDLTERAARLELRLNRVARWDDETVIEHLIQVKGVGRWTAQMFLIFGLGRLNVLPHADLGIQTAIRQQYGLRKNPNPARIDKLAAPWQPYCSVASWYLWQSLGNTPKE
jgi:DNA-3-methyladenine glycosylase II